MTLSVRDVEARNRFEAWEDDRPTGFAEYLRGDQLVVYPHTVVEPAFEGRGIGSALARAALDDARARGLAVLATCPFIKGWMLRHPEFTDFAYDTRSRVAR